MTQPLDYRVPAPPVRQCSLYGMGSFALGLLTPVLYFMMLSHGAGARVSMAGLLALLVMTLGVPAIGLTLGIASLRTPGRQRAFAIAGVSMNGLFVLLPLASVVLYFASGGT